MFVLPLILYWKCLLQFHKIGTLEVVHYISSQAIQCFAKIYDIVKTVYFIHSSNGMHK